MIRIVLFAAAVAICVPLRAQTTATPASSPSSAPTLEQRVTDLEAYVNNAPRGADAADARTSSNISGPGPGHNAWLMTSTLLVLFMTLPGLALFYGGMVRRKNVLSVMAQCLGCAGLVTVLWWLIGYSLVFAPGSSILGGTKFATSTGFRGSFVSTTRTPVGVLPVGVRRV